MNLETEISKPLWQAVRRSYESQAWSNAVLDAIHFLSEAIRSKTGLQSDGTALAGQAFGGKAPKLRLNRLETESEKNLQTGMEQLHRGLYQAIRNPRSHEKLEDSQQTADALIVFINYLLGVIGHAKASFSIDQCVARIMDDNFVPNERYAQLVVQEIPARHVLHVALAVFRAKDPAKGKRLRYFFDTAIPLLSEAEAAELFSAISEELLASSDDGELRATFQLLNPTHWLKAGEAARLRSEHRIVANIHQGRYNATRGVCSGGGMATWAKEFLRHFTLKREVLWALNSLLSSGNKDSEDYAFEYFAFYLDSLEAKPPYWLEKTFAEGLERGDVRFRDCCTRVYGEFGLWEGAMGERVAKAMAEFKETPKSEEFGDDIPF